MAVVMVNGQPVMVEGKALSVPAGGGRTVQADLAQNDPSAADYVKNRPGGYYGDPVTVEEEIYSGEIEQRATEILVDSLLVAGKAYKVTIGEVTKTYTAFADSYNNLSGVTIGDATLEEAVGSEEMFAMMSVDLEGEKGALIVFPNADVGKTIRVTTETQKREVHKIPMELLDLGGVDENIKRTNAALNALNDQHTSDISAINKMLTEGPITLVGPGKTSSLILGKFADMGFQIRWEVSDGSYCYMNRQGFVVNNKTHGTNISVSGSNISVVEQTKGSGIRFTLENGDNNGGTRFSVGNVAGDLTTFYASGKIINSNRLLKLYASSTITEDNATTLRGVKTPEQDYDAANKKYVDQRLPSPATAQVGQIVKVKSVDESGKITETEAVDIPMQKTLKWITVHSSDLTETKRELIISTDTDGKSIVDYNPVGLSLIVSTPADATVESNNGSPWVYPSATKADNAIRVIGNISGWKNVARDSAFVFNGGSSAMSCTGNVNTSLATYKLDGYALDGVRIFFNSANDHLPVGTHVEVAILCEVEE